MRIASLVHVVVGWRKWNAYGGKGWNASEPKHLVVFCKVLAPIDEEVGGVNILVILIAGAGIVAMPECLFAQTASRA